MWEGVPLSSEALGEAFQRKLLLLVGFPHGNTKAVHRWPGGDGVSGLELRVRGLNGR